ncbi:MAG: 16S rRNA (adenine(1518)-N(6)/adenine(1519)-N(6))-dimethyltransferase RsmA [Patescibacteria group bacterium]
MKTKKSLGQHFLKSEKALKSIVEAGKIESTDCILEIGPGTGALTGKLLQTGATVVAVEKDDELSLFLKEIYKKEIENGKFEIINEDILEFNLSNLEKGYKLIANIPYNITGLIFKKFLESEFQPSLMVLLVQKEVAERIVARNGKESILSVSVKAYGEPRFVEKVLAGSFSPVPKVDSAIIAIEDISKKFFDNFSEKDFFEMLHAGFKSKRKKLSSNLSTLFKKEKILETFNTLGLDENIRAEDVSLENWKKISAALLNT